VESGFGDATSRASLRLSAHIGVHERSSYGSLMLVTILVILCDAQSLRSLHVSGIVALLGLLVPRAATALGRLRGRGLSPGFLRPVVEPWIGNQVSFILKHVEEIDGTCVGEDTWDSGQMLCYHHTISRCLRAGFHSLTRQS
jgi:hypothetical protein